MGTSKQDLGTEEDYQVSAHPLFKDVIDARELCRAMNQEAGYPAYCVYTQDEGYIVRPFRTAMEELYPRKVRENEQETG